jgi:hypothetical protein
MNLFLSIYFIDFIQHFGNFLPAFCLSALLYKLAIITLQGPVKVKILAKNVRAKPSGQVKEPQATGRFWYY